MIRPWFLLSVLIVALLAGCFNQPPPAAEAPTVTTLPAVPADFYDPLILGHDHSNAALHNLAYHMTLLAHHPLGGNALKSSGAHAIEVQNGYLFVAAYGAQVDVAGGLYIFDIKTNPEQPRLVGQLNLPGNLGGDRSMEATDDGDFVALGEEAQDCAGHVNPFGPGLYLIDTRDKTRPTIADYLPATGVHSVIIHRIAGDDYIFGLMSGQNIVKIDRSGLKPALKPVGTVRIGHDGAAYDDPVLGKPILYAADGNAVLYIYDLSTPATPTLLGKWTPADKDHYVHAVAVDFIDGKRIIIVESEDWKTAPSPMWVIDGDDLANPELLSTWINPGAAPADAGEHQGQYGGQLIFSTHNPRIENGIVYMAHYHGGVWALDVSSTAKTLNPQILGYYLPHDNNGGFVPRSGEGAYPKPNACGFDLDEIPETFDVEVHNGIVYAADLHTGMYALKLDNATVTHP